MSSKRHHYVPKTYLQEFTDAEGSLTVFRKTVPPTHFRSSPTNVALEQYYYAYTREDNTRDTDSLEQKFSEIETGWPDLVLRLNGGSVSHKLTERLLEFVCLQRARVPAVRDAYELMRADTMGHTARVLQRFGKLPGAPPGSKDILERVEIAIDPESSIHAIAITMQGMIERIIPMLGFRIIHNEAGIDLITSDNPVAWFIPYKNETSTKPYEMRPGAPLELIFPITPKLLLVGHSVWLDEFLVRGTMHGSVSSIEAIKRANRMLAKFGYSAIFAKDDSPVRLVEKYSGISPVSHSTAFPTENGQLVAVHMEFSRRRSKAKWCD